MIFNLFCGLSLLAGVIAAFQNNPLATVLGLASAFGWLIAGILDDTISLLDGNRTFYVGDRNV